MHDPKTEGQRWFDQADNDLEFARYAYQGEFFHQVCFVAHQCAEEALKALHYAAGARSVVGHSVAGLLARLIEKHGDLEVLQDLAAELDLYYIPTRYPNGLIEGALHQAFTHSQADRALKSAETVLEAARKTFGS